MKHQGAIFLLIYLFSLKLLGQTGFIPGTPELAYWEFGDKKEIVIVLHGGPCAQHQYLRPEFDGLSEVATVIYYDQRGCGESSIAKSYHWKDHVDDLYRLMKNISPNNKVFFASSSWGSWLALLFSYKHPELVKGLILSGLVYWEGEGMKPLEYEEHKNRRLKNVVSPDIHIFDITEKRIRETINEVGEIEKVFEEIERPVIQNIGMSSAEPRISMLTAPILDSLNHIKIPCLLFNGPPPCNYDKAVKQYAKVLENSWVCSIEGSCHDPWLSNPEEFLKKSHIFINELKRKRKNIFNSLDKKLN